LDAHDDDNSFGQLGTDEFERDCVAIAKRIDALSWAFAILQEVHEAQTTRLPLLAGIFMRIIAQDTDNLVGFSMIAKEDREDALLLPFALEKLLRARGASEAFKRVARGAMLKAGDDNIEARLANVVKECATCQLDIGAFDDLKDELREAVAREIRVGPNGNAGEREV
jgi:hypothetical protein